MKTTETAPSLSDLLADLNEEAVLEEVRLRMQKGDDPLILVEECQQGMHMVGERYESGVYYISGLVMAADIMNQVGNIALPGLAGRLSGNESGRILLGTVEGDIHYIGKDILKVLLRCYGFTVFDIGVDVSSKEFLAQAKMIKPHIVGLSCLLSPCYGAMQSTIALLRAEKSLMCPAPSFIIGGLVNEQVCRHVGADRWADDAVTGVRLCREIIRENP